MGTYMYEHISHQQSSYCQLGLLLLRNFFVNISGPILPDSQQLLTK